MVWPKMAAMTALEIANPRAPGPPPAAHSSRPASASPVAAQVATNLPAARPSARWSFVRPAWVPWIFAAKTTLSALLTQLIAFTFNLDQPKWALLTVFIVAQPASGMVLAKSFHRIIGTFTGVAVALLFVALFAQERVLFLGALAAWIGICTFASQYAKSFAAYGFVLSGYTAAIVGIPGALDPGNAFYVATARVTEISLGIIVTAAVSHLILPVSLAGKLRQEVADARSWFADYALAVLRGGDDQSLRTKLLGEVVRIEDFRASAIFEEHEIRGRRDALRRLGAAFVEAFGSCQLLMRQRVAHRQGHAVGVAGEGEAVAQASLAIRSWRYEQITAAGLGERLLRARASLPLVQPLCRDASVTDGELVRASIIIARLREVFASFAAYGGAYERFFSPGPTGERRTRFATAGDWRGAAWAGLRAALALLLVAIFWIAADWPSGSTAVILSAVVTARLATMNRAGEAAIGATIAVVLGTVPAFLIIEVLLSQASGFEMFALVLAPVLFLCAFLMAHDKSPVAVIFGFLLALYVASVGGFADRTVYDAVGFVNTSFAVILSIAVGAILFALVAPDTLDTARRRFARVARRALAKATDPASGIPLAEFETTIVAALDPLRGHLDTKDADAVAAWEAGVALLGAGRELIAVARDSSTAIAQQGLLRELAALLRRPDAKRLARVRALSRGAAAEALAGLRSGALGASATRAAIRAMVAFSTLDDELGRAGNALLVR